VPERVFREEWVVYAGLLRLLTGSLDFLEGLIAIIKGQYYFFSPDQILVVDLTTWAGSSSSGDRWSPGLGSCSSGQT
jgi:hypothetical protein